MLQFLNEVTASWNPWKELDRIHWELDRLIPEAFSVFNGSNRAPVAVYANDEAAKVLVQIPGWKPGWFDLSVEGNKLHLKGQSVAGEAVGGNENMQLSLSRTINLPFHVRANKIQAHYSKGILTIDLARSEKDKPQKIKIQAA